MFFPFHDDNPTRRVAWVTYVIIALNAMIFLWFNYLPAKEKESVILRRGFVPARVGQIFHQKPIVESKMIPVFSPFFGKRVVRHDLIFPPDRKAIFISTITSLFLHGSWMHLIGNMWFLWIFGTNVEDRLGHGPFLFFYLLGGIFASIFHWTIDMGSFAPVIGASGAVAAVLGAYAITWPWARVHTLVFLFVFVTIIEVPALLVLGIWFAVQLMEGHAQLALNTSGGVAWWAHVGGFLVGMAMMPFLDVLMNGRRSQQSKTVPPAETPQ